MQAQNESIACFVSINKNFPKIVLYDTTKVKSFVDVVKFDNSIIGMIELASCHGDVPSYGAYEVKYAAANQGYGPLLYDIAMSEYGAIISDRDGEVSNFARKIWKYYFTSRPDVLKLHLDDYENPQTPDRDDDGQIYDPATSENYLNYAYKCTQKIDITAMKQKHLACVDKFRNFKSKGLFEDALGIEALGFFGKKYRDVTDMTVNHGFVP